MAITMLTNENFDSEVMNADKTVLVDFYADWCGPCKMQSPIVDEIDGERDDVKVCKINIDQQPELAMRFGVMSIPTIMVVKNGETTFKEPGLMQKRDLLKLL
ncbi:MAG: thioredoxin [Eubacteriales bacterium]|jgi:thioredoxin 1|uniref:Thioredoxin n=1 Tax=Baileyella intestinalis TaxID=2606709 RepID=A0A6A8M735_9FIRM|nr:thioredoxin [Baileyella intestinalis]MDD5875526.1 thioredoxin [Baileyella intestinalis]MDY2994352.1 thioredoxin [Baileyella intestinalis]MST68623.1 thioredoxin [Baileyella intestinalis]